MPPIASDSPYHAPEVRIWVEAAQAGDQAAFGLLMERFQRDVYGKAFSIVKNHLDADDVVQETFLRAYRDLGRYDGRAPFSSWIYGICVNVSYDAGKRRRRAWEREKPLGDGGSEALAHPAPGAEAEILARQEAGRLRECLGKLPETLRSALLLRYQEDLPLEAVAQSLSIGLSAAKMRVQRGLEQLRGLCRDAAPGGTP